MDAFSFIKLVYFFTLAIAKVNSINYTQHDPAVETSQERHFKLVNR